MITDLTRGLVCLRFVRSPKPSPPTTPVSGQRQRRPTENPYLEDHPPALSLSAYRLATSKPFASRAMRVEHSAGSFSLPYWLELRAWNLLTPLVVLMAPVHHFRSTFLSARSSATVPATNTLNSGTCAVNNGPLVGIREMHSMSFRSICCTTACFLGFLQMIQCSKTGSLLKYKKPMV